MQIGVLLDVSGSMRESYNRVEINNSTNQTINRTRIDTIFDALYKIFEKRPDTSLNELFVLAFGLDAEYGDVIDLIQLLEIKSKAREFSGSGKRKLIDLVNENNNGANYSSDYDNFIEENIDDDEACFLYTFYSENTHILRNILRELPREGRYVAQANNASKQVQKLLWLGSVLTVPMLPFVALPSGLVLGAGLGLGLGSAKLTEKSSENMITDNVEKNIQKAKRILIEIISSPVSKSLRSAVDIIKKLVDNNNPRTEDFSKLVKEIEPFVYGNTPMCKAIENSLELFQQQQHNILYLITDGDATDGDPLKFKQNLDNKNVLVIVCIITSKNIGEPRRLYYEAVDEWTKGQKAMFNLCSVIENGHSAMSVLLDYGWELPKEGHSRLFVQVNHPKVIEELSSLVRKISENNDPLLNIYTRVQMDQYIMSGINEFKPNDQIGGTCYANAVAAVLHMAMRRIYEREGSLPNFDDLLRELIKKFGSDGANTEKVLDEWAKKYRLHYKEVNEDEARMAINKRRPVVSTFRLDDEQWRKFSDFYFKTPTGILESRFLGLDSGKKKSGHAVVLIRCDPNSLEFINSWGNEWANKGFFKVKNASVLNLKFYDVYWTLDDLTPNEKLAYEARKEIDAQRLIRNFKSELSHLPYECPICKQSSPVKEFTGSFLEIACPRCSLSFKPTAFGFIFIQN